MAQQILEDAYLYIVYGKSKNYYVKEYTKIQKQQLQNLQNQSLQNANSSKYGIGYISKRLGMAVYTSPIVQNFASKNIPNSLLSRLNSSLYDIMADGKISVMEVADDFIRTGTNVLDGVALDLGFPTVSTLYNAIRPDGTGIFSKDINGTALTFIKSLSKNANKQNNVISDKENNNLSENNEVIKFKLVTKDSETWATDTPERKTESGMSLVPVLGNNNLEKDFTVSVINGSDNTSMYDVKKQLKLLRDKRESFDIYVVDKDVNETYALSNCVFTNISVDVNAKNSLIINLSLLQIPEYSVLTDVNISEKHSKNYGNTTSSKKSKSKSKKSGVSKSGNKNKVKTSNKVRKQRAQVYVTERKEVARLADKAEEAYKNFQMVAYNPNATQHQIETATKNLDKSITKLTNELNKSYIGKNTKIITKERVFKGIQAGDIYYYNARW